MRKIGKGAHHLDGSIAREAVQGGLEFGARCFVVIAPKLHRDLTDALDGREDRFSLLLTEGVAEDAAEQPDILPQRQIALWKIDDVHVRPAACRGRRRGSLNDEYCIASRLVALAEALRVCLPGGCDGWPPKAHCKNRTLKIT